ncbi:MAG: hypothetical protein JF888_01020 [Candidatus Dormibacteraeota bacterium]|uniref:Uncharacterized protein n=2 Tax=Candidatus Dormibacteraceae TaxID=3126998 RepID=A0A934K7Z9_9BACT|nr:hypothetical protein [Candidatus Dormibacteraeota bacterium]MBJ7601772.1 hypothetical protein [Candidatus Dormibacteraeota bacterium]
MAAFVKAALDLHHYSRHDSREVVGRWADQPAYIETAGVVMHWLWRLPSEPLLHSLARLRRVLERELQ